MGRNRHGVSANPRVQEQLRAAEKLALSQRDHDLREVLASPSGRRFLLDVIDRRCGSHGTGYSASGSEMYFLAGQRSVGIELREDLKRVDVDGYSRMMLEAFQADADKRVTREAMETKSITEADDDEQEA